LHAQGKPKEAYIEAVIIRADGTRVNLGRVSYWHRNPFRRLWWWLFEKRNQK
jgi:hypothetical protein